MKTLRRPVKAITFDFFNTLVRHRREGGGRGGELMEYLDSAGLESDPWEHQVLYDVLEPHGREYSPELGESEKKSYRRRLAERVFRRLNVRSDSSLPEEHAPAIWDILGPTSLRVFPEVEGALDGLRAAGFRLAVISNWQCGLAHFCAELGLSRYFEHIVASAEVGSEKPDSEIFVEAFRRLGVSPQEVLHVGDTPRDDLEGADRVGCQGVLIARGEAPEGWDGPAIGGLEELEAILPVD